MMKKLKNKGFTLTELLVVVTLIGILTTFAVPRYLTNLEVSRVSEATDYLRQWQAARAIIYAETQHYTSAHRMEYLAFDNAVIHTETNGWTSAFANFCCYSSEFTATDSQDNQQTLAAAYCRRRASNGNCITNENNNNADYYIYATETNMYCCWDDVNHHSAGKICNSVSSGIVANNEAITTNPTFAGMTCYTINDN